MLRAWKQRHLHQKITLMFMLKGPKIRKAPKKIHEKDVPWITKKHKKLCWEKNM